MTTGALWTVELHNDGTRILDSVTFKPTTYAAADLAASTAKVEKVIKTNDGVGISGHTHSWKVKLSWIAADIPANSTTLTNIISACETAISVAYGSAELSA